MNRFNDIDFSFKRLPPVHGYHNEKLVSIEEALTPLVSQIHGLSLHMREARNKCHFPSEHGLTHDESASIYIYTMEWGANSLYYILNEALRSENRYALKIWFPYMKLFDSALNKLPIVKQIVWRGISRVINAKFKKDDTFTWWSVNSCSSSIEIIKNFLGDEKDSIIFRIEAINGIKISGYTRYENEDEVILKIGSEFRVYNDALEINGVRTIHLIQIDDINIPSSSSSSLHIETISEESLSQITSVIKQMYVLNEHTTPRYFFILPTRYYDMALSNIEHNWSHIHFKLYFFCECSLIPHEMHVAPHEGYLIKNLRDFIVQYGEYLRVTSNIIRILLSNGRFDISQSDLNYSKNYQNIEQQLKLVEKLINKVSKKQFYSNSLTNDTDLSELETHLDLSTDKNNLGNLYRTINIDGHILWICLKHYDDISFSNEMRKYINKFKTMEGKFNDDTKEAIIRQTHMSGENIRILGNSLTKGFNIIKAIFQDCSFYESDLNILLDFIINHSAIRYLKFTDIRVLNYFGLLKHSHKAVIVEFNNQLLKVRFSNVYPKENILMLNRLMLQNEIHRKLDFSAYDFFEHEKSLQQSLGLSKVITGLIVEYSNNIHIINAIFNSTKNTLCYLKLTHSLCEPSTLSHFCKILQKNKTLVELNLMDQAGFIDETFIIDLLDIIRDHNSMKYLNLHVQDVQPSSKKEIYLIKSLKDDKFISHLRISASTISHELIEALVIAAKEHHTLTHLEFYNSYLEKEDMSELKSLNNDGTLIQLIFCEPTHCQMIADNMFESIREVPLRSSLIAIHPSARWEQKGLTVAGGHGSGSETHHLSYPYGIYVDDDQTVYVADRENHRVVEWKVNATCSEVIAGGNGRGDGTHQLFYPSDIIVNKEKDSLIICDSLNRRVVQWSRRNRSYEKTIISGVYCWGLTMDENRSLYVVDFAMDDVKRYQRGESKGTIIAGGKIVGIGLDQLHEPTYIFVDRNHSVYVSDLENHRVMKWMEGAKQGIIVAGGKGQGNGLAQLSFPRGIVVDELGTVYVADSWNDRIMRWVKGATQGTVILGGNGQGRQSNQFNYPMGLSFDRHGNLYVSDRGNHRIQKFNIKWNEYSII